MTSEPEGADAGDRRRLRRAIIVAGLATGLLWLVWLLSQVLQLDLVTYGVYPRRVSGLAGVLTAVLVHGSTNHLLANSAPVLVLIATLLYGYPRSARVVLPVLYLGTGVLVWLFARPAWHLGASGVTFGMMFFVFTIGILRWDRRAIALSLSVFMLYGGMFAGLAPADAGISFESHLAGALLGVLLAVLLRNRDPRPPPPRYSWEDEAEGSGEAQG